MAIQTPTQTGTVGYFIQYATVLKANEGGKGIPSINPSLKLLKPKT